jgi:ELWxxDGT repeat protein
MDFDRRTAGLTGVNAASLADRVVFTHGSPHGAWVTDGTAEGTSLLRSLPGPATAMTVVGNAAYFVTGPSAERVLWRTDGTPSGTGPVHDLLRVDGDSIAVLDGTLFVIGRIGGDGLATGLIRSDGTAAGTVRINALPQAPTPANLTASGSKLFFTVPIVSGPSQLWTSDGTAAGTVKVLDLADPPEKLVGTTARLFFITRGPGTWRSLWSSDGTAGGTVHLEWLGQIDAGVVALEDGVYYRVFNGIAGPSFNYHLKKSNGTADGTIVVKENVGAGSITVVGSRVFFVNSSSGRALWTSDGTETGTVHVADVNASGAWYSLSLLGAIAGHLYFTDDDGVHGTELWVSDGTAAGTRIVHDVNPGAAPSHGGRPVRLNSSTIGDRLVFFADDGVHGTEPWATPLLDGSPSPPNTFVLGRHVFYNNSRYDGRDPAANADDDSAIAPDKRALPPGGDARFEHLTSYSRGINGIMVDIDRRFDFFDHERMSFRVGTGTDRAAWRTAPEPLSVTRRSGAGVAGGERVTVIWADGAIRNTWLEVTVEALFAGRVVATDVFYYGNLAGETGDAPAPAAATRVTAQDYRRTRAAMPARNIDLSSPFDHNRDGALNVLDAIIARGNGSATLNSPTVPSGGASAFAAKRRPRYRPGLWLNGDPAA